MVRCREWFNVFISSEIILLVYDSQSFSCIWTVNGVLTSTFVDWIWMNNIGPGWRPAARRLCGQSEVGRTRPSEARRGLTAKLRTSLNAGLRLKRWKKDRRRVSETWHVKGGAVSHHWRPCNRISSSWRCVSVRASDDDELVSALQADVDAFLRPGNGCKLCGSGDSVGRVCHLK